MVHVSLTQQLSSLPSPEMEKEVRQQRVGIFVERAVTPLCSAFCLWFSFQDCKTQTALFIKQRYCCLICCLLSNVYIQSYLFSFNLPVSFLRLWRFLLPLRFLGFTHFGIEVTNPYLGGATRNSRFFAAMAALASLLPWQCRSEPLSSSNQHPSCVGFLEWRRK